MAWLSGPLQIAWIAIGYFPNGVRQKPQKFHFCSDDDAVIKGRDKLKAELRITTTIAAALLGACSSQAGDGWETADRDTAICSDKSGNRVPDANCQQPRSYGGGAGSAFLWYYLGRNSAVPYYGERVGGGSYQRAAGVSYFRAPAASSMSRSAAISRGGFGSSARGFGGAGE